MGGIAQLFGTIFAPIGTLFHIFFYQPVFNLLMLIYTLLGSFAFSVVVLTLLIRSCLIPLTRKQLRSSREMQALAPKLNELKAQYRNDPQGMMAAQQALYKEHGVSPMAGCLPLVIQMPFLYAMYYSFYTVINAINGTAATHFKPNLNIINQDIYPFMPKLTQLPDLHFLWTNLGHPDPLHILPVLAAVLTLIQLRMAMPVRKKGPTTQQDPTSQATQTTMYIMPLMTLFIGWNFASGLALYWCITTLFSAVQQYFIAGWGSLFVGIPGMEHLVPAPKESPALATATPSRAGLAGGAAGARALAAPAQTPPAEGGMRGFFKQFRDTMAAAQSQAAAQAEARLAEKQGGASGPVVDEKPSAVEREAGASSQARRDRRQRPAKAGPILVKPPTQPSGELPEQAIAREGKDTTPVESDVLPEVAISRDATSNGNKINGTNGTSSANGLQIPGKSGGAQAANGSRKGGSGGNTGGGANSKGGSSAQRPRGGRPKGSR